MTTTITKSIGTNARDYSTLQSWQDAGPADLVAVDQVWKGEAYNDSEFLSSGTVALDFVGPIEDATRYQWLTVAAGHSFRDNANKLTNALRYNQANGVGIRVTGTYSILVVGSYFTKMDRVQLYYNSTYGSNYYLPVSFVGGVIDGVLFQQDRGGGQGFRMAGSGKVINSAFVHKGTAGNLVALGSTASLLNCTLLRPTDLPSGGEAIVTYFADSVTIKNCAVFGPFSSFFPDTSVSAASDYNATSHTSAPGVHSLANLTTTSQFENTLNASHDPRVKSSNGLVAGVRDASNTNDLDIIGQARSTTVPTIGAWEYVEAGGSEIEADLSQTLENSTLASSATVAVVASAAQTLDNASTQGSGLTEDEADVIVTLDSVVIAAVAVAALSAQLGVTLDNAASSATASVAGVANHTVTLADAVLTAEATVVAAGQYGLSQVLQDTSLASSATSKVDAGATVALADAGVSADSDALVAGVSNVMLGAVAIDSIATASVHCELEVTLEGATLQATMGAYSYTRSIARTWMVPAQNRRYLIAAQNRRYVV